MKQQFKLSLLALFFSSVFCVSQFTAAGTEQFVVLSDIHAYGEEEQGPKVSPKATCPANGRAACPTCQDYYHDTTDDLFASMLSDIACNGYDKAKFVIVSGDWIAHHYLSPGNAVKKKQIMTTLTKLLRQQFDSNTLLIPALGNNDAYEGDYNLQANGKFLTDMKTLWEPGFPASTHLGTCLNPSGNPAPAKKPSDLFEESFMAGGYYAFSNPNLPNNCTLVLNTVLLMDNYINGFSMIGNKGNTSAPAKAQLKWLTGRLAEARTAKLNVWLIYHVPPGVDAYASAKKKRASTNLANHKSNNFAKMFVDIMANYKDVIKVAFAGHSHLDSFRVLYDDEDNPVSWVHISPSVTPDHHDGRSAYQVFDYETSGGSKPAILKDYVTRHVDYESIGLPNDWQQEYNWKDSLCHDTCSYDASDLGGVYENLKNELPRYEENYRKYLGEGGSAFSDESKWIYYRCAIGNLRAKDFNDCVKPDRNKD